MRQHRFPPGWDEERVRQVLKHYEEQTEVEAIKNVYRNASFIGNNRVIFNIRGNQYRLVVAINYAQGIVYIRFIGSHQDYDTINAATI